MSIVIVPKEPVIRSSTCIVCGSILMSANGIGPEAPFEITHVCGTNCALSITRNPAAFIGKAARLAEIEAIPLFPPEIINELNAALATVDTSSKKKFGVIIVKKIRGVNPSIHYLFSGDTSDESMADLKIPDDIFNRLSSRGIPDRSTLLMYIDEETGEHSFGEVHLCRLNTLCSGCGVYGEKKARMCSGCKTVRFCDEACQAEHWSEHRDECKRLRRERTN